MTLLELPFPDIDPVAIAIGPVRIHWYAIMYLLAFAMAHLLMRRRLKKEPFRSVTTPRAWSPTDVEDLLLFGIGGVIIGGRLGYALFYQPSYYLAHPLDVFKVWDGGMSFHGGAIGVVLAMVIFAWRRGRPFLQIADLLVPAVPLGLAAGRIGNFINGELWGRQAPADLPWAMRFPNGGNVLRHPSQLYQALLEGVLLFVLLWFYARKPRRRGQVAAAFLMGYGVFRFIAEYWREPDSYLGFLSLGLSMGQWLSVPMILAGIALWMWAERRGITDGAAPEDDDAPAGSAETGEAEQDPDEGDSGASDAPETGPDTDADAQPSPSDAASTDEEDIASTSAEAADVASGDVPDADTPAAASSAVEESDEPVDDPGDSVDDPGETEAPHDADPDKH
ncbi:MAG: prolipoprotein diacylglyceryl transferase [Propionibacteriaceae bacterium]|nr:prolipoprotein diacylglyceryl transferase [Propionibacteriaceae bacterium]